MYMYVLRAEVLTIFGSRIFIFTAPNAKTIQNFKLCTPIFSYIVEHFAIKLCDLTNFNTFFPAVVIYFFHLSLKEKT